MMSAPSDNNQQKPDVIGTLKQAKDIWEIGTWIVTAGTTLVTFIRGVGGPVQFLVEVGFYGFACYMAAFVFVPLVTLILTKLEEATQRTTTDAFGIILLGIALLGGGALIRFGLFAEGLTEGLDAIGTAFGALVGFAILLMPVFLFWYYRGSKPNAA
jgi:hypothetical protein